MVKNCQIVRSYPENTSDHLPLLTSLNVDTGSSKISNDSYIQPRTFPKCNWDSPKFCENFANNRNDCLDNMPSLHCKNITSAQETVDTFCNDLIGAIHDSVNKSQYETNSSKKHRKKVHWWNNDCSIARNRQRFWYNIWIQCNRARSGQVFQCYKLAKKEYRRTYIGLLLIMLHLKNIIH